MKHGPLTISLLVLALSIGGWSLYRGTVNLSGRCEALGRQLTAAEMRQKIIENQSETQKKRPNWSIINDAFNWAEEPRLESDDFLITVNNFNTQNNTQIDDFWVYPDIPEYAQEPNGILKSYSNSSWYDWGPVTFWYRITGYAKDLIFFDLDVTATSKDGRVITRHYDYRAWLNSCGEVVPLPTEYEVG